MTSCRTYGSGHFPFAPEHVIVPDESLAPTVRRLFELCATGRYSIKELGAVVRQERLTVHGDRPMPTSTVHKILRNRVYSGDFEWDGNRYHGTHEPIVPADLWEQAQSALDGRLAKRAKKTSHSLPILPVDVLVAEWRERWPDTLICFLDHALPGFLGEIIDVVLGH
jgi:hypothetical protein